MGRYRVRESLERLAARLHREELGQPDGDAEPGAIGVSDRRGDLKP
jgi:hypothetical protein